MPTTYTVEWDKTGEHFYETGVDHGVLYKYVEADPEVTGDTAGFKNGVAWNGLTAVNESPSGAEPSPLYADNIKYLNLISAEEYAASIEAFTYPDEFEECDGSKNLVGATAGVYVGQQPRTIFGLCYRTLVGNDIKAAGVDPEAYKLHLVYNCTASPSEKAHATVNDNPEAQTMSWEISTTPVEVTGMKPTACITIDAKKVGKTKMDALLAILYGDGTTQPRLPYPTELATLLAA